jgi:hypothetical protein
VVEGMLDEDEDEDDLAGVFGKEGEGDELNESGGGMFDDVAKVFGEKDEGDELNEMDGMLDDVSSSTEVDVGIEVVIRSKVDRLAEDVGGVICIVVVVIAERQKVMGGLCILWIPAHQFAHQLQRHWEVKHPAPGDASCVADTAGDAPS